MNNLLKYCDAKNIKLTPLRKEVLELVSNSKHPVTAYQILRQLRETRSNAEPPTVYRVLQFLEEERLIHRIETTNTYITCVHPDMPLGNQILLCNSCGDATEIHDDRLSAALKDSAKLHGFSLGEELIEIRGQCTNCHHQQH